MAKEAWTLDLIPQSSYLKIQALTGVKYERLPKGRSLTGKEACGLLTACDDGTNQGKRDKAMFALMLGCGLRRAEVVQLEMKDWTAATDLFVSSEKATRSAESSSQRKSTGSLTSGSWRGGWKTEYFSLESARAQIKVNFSSEQCSRLPSTGFSKNELDWLSWVKFVRMTCAGLLPQGCLNRDAIFFILQRAMGHTSVATTSRYDYRGETSREEVCKHLDVFL